MNKKGQFYIITAYIIIILVIGFASIYTYRELHSGVRYDIEQNFAEEFYNINYYVLNNSLDEDETKKVFEQFLIDFDTYAKSNGVNEFEYLVVLNERGTILSDYSDEYEADIIEIDSELEDHEVLAGRRSNPGTKNTVVAAIVTIVNFRYVLRNLPDYQIRYQKDEIDVDLPRDQNWEVGTSEKVGNLKSRIGGMLFKIF